MMTCSDSIPWCSIRNLDVQPVLDGSAGTVRWHLARLFAGVTVVAAFASCGQRDTGLAQLDTQIKQVYFACVQEMLQSTCKVSNDASPDGQSAPARVFVAGTGQIDAVSYQRLRAAGDAMCSVVRTSCTKDWSGPGCRTARSLWAR